MQRFAVRGLALVLRLCWLASIVIVVALVAVAQVAPRDGRSMFIVRGGSMTPTIPLGALIVVAPASGEQLQVGDVISLRRGQTTVTHRIVGIETQAGQPMFHTKGDANQSPDPRLATSADVIGRVVLSLPFAGMLLYFLGEPAGITAVLSFLGTLLLARWYLDDLITGRRPSPFPPAPEAAAPALS